MEVARYRLVEALAMLPMLHVPVKHGTKVGVLGPVSTLMAEEVHRWPDVSEIYITKEDPHLTGKKYIISPEMPLVDVLLLSPEQNPTEWTRHVTPGGIIAATTAQPENFQRLVSVMRDKIGNATPWREHLPAPIYGCLSYVGIGKIKRYRKTPKSAKRLSDNYIPCLFTFGKDEISLAFKQPVPIILNAESVVR